MSEAVTHLTIDSVAPSRRNPRRGGKRVRDLKGLIQSILAVGVLQPILVRPRGDKFELIAGERRWRASKAAGLPTVPAIVRDGVEDGDAMEMTVTENLQRADLHPVEEAEGVAALLGKGWDVRAIADRIGRSPTWVARRAHLTNLSAAWRERIADPTDVLSEWSGAHLDLIARLDGSVQNELLESYLCQELPTVGELERQLADLTQKLTLAPWGLDDESLAPESGPCSSCPKTSGCHPGLFDDELGQDRKAGGRCLDQACWKAKLAAHVERRRSELTNKHPDLVAVNGRSAYNDGTSEKLPGAHEFEKVRKSTLGAKLVFVARGSDAGRSFWGKPFGFSGGNGHATRQAGPLSQEEKEKRLALRRQAHAVNAAKEAIEKLDGSPPPDLVFALAAAYGTSHRCDGPGASFAHPADTESDDSSEWTETDPWELLQHMKETPGRVAETLWRATRKVLLRRWTWNRLDGVEAVALEAFGLGRVLGVDVARLEAEAENAIPRPKAWASNGDPKKTPKKANRRKRC